MARGGARPGAGRPKGVKAGQGKKNKIPADIRKAARKAKLSPLEYMLDVMNDDGAANDRRDRMAVAAAPFVHPRKEPVGEGKKQKDQEAAQQAGQGIFAAPRPPKLVIDNG